MSTSECTLYAPNLICICINSADGGDYAGDIWNQYQDEPKIYNNSLELIKKMDALYDEWDFPQRSTNSRTFGQKEEEVQRTGKKEARLQMDTRRVQERKGDKGTFIVQVKYRQNATWQGEVIWTERKQKQYFRSALELLKLIDSALEAGEEEKKDSDEKLEEYIG